MTENRAVFLPWLLWNFDRQTWPNRELVIVDSSEQPFTSERTDIRVVTMARGTSIADKRNRALFEALGQYVAWFDDDDWQHPDRLTDLAGSLERGNVDVAGCTSAWFLDLLKGRCAPYRPVGELIFNSCVARAKVCKGIRFDPRIQRASDTPWMLELSRASASRVLVARKTYGFWLCHDTNVSNPRSQRRCVLPLSILSQSTGEAAWGDTECELSALRSRLSLGAAGRSIS